MVGAPGRKSRDPSVTSEGEDLPAPHRFSPGRDVRKRNAETQMLHETHLLIPLPLFNEVPLRAEDQATARANSFSLRSRRAQVAEGWGGRGVEVKGNARRRQGCGSGGVRSSRKPLTRAKRGVWRREVAEGRVGGRGIRGKGSTHGHARVPRARSTVEGAARTHRAHAPGQTAEEQGQRQWQRRGRLQHVRLRRGRFGRQGGSGTSRARAPQNGTIRVREGVSSAGRRRSVWCTMYGVRGGVSSARRAAAGRRRRRHARARDGCREHRMGGSARWTAQWCWQRKTSRAWAVQTTTRTRTRRCRERRMGGSARWTAQCTVCGVRGGQRSVRCVVCGAVFSVRCTVYGVRLRTVYSCVLCTTSYCALLCTAYGFDCPSLRLSVSPSLRPFVSQGVSSARRAVPGRRRRRHARARDGCREHRMGGSARWTAQCTVCGVPCGVQWCRQRKTNRAWAAQTTTRTRTRRVPRAPYGREREVDSAVYGVWCAVRCTMYGVRCTVYDVRFVLPRTVYCPVLGTASYLVLLRTVY